MLPSNKEPVISKNEAFFLDKKAYEKNKIPSIILMEEASENIYKQILNDFTDIDKHKIAIVAGPGNNGGDALSLARKLLFSDIKFDIFLISSNKGSELLEIHKGILDTLGVTFYSIKSLKSKIKNYTLIIDAIFGIGYKYRDDDEILRIFKLINNSSAIKISIDTPSGLNTDLQPCINADITYSIGFLKNYFFTINSRKLAGKIKDIKISFDINNIELNNQIQYLHVIQPLNKKNNNYVHKYSRGGCIAIGGQKGKYGSIVMTSMTALRIGAGISLVITEKENIDKINEMSKEILVDGFEELKNSLKKYKSIVIGPGLSLHQNINKEYIDDIISEDKYFILDASFFSIFSKEILQKFKNQPLLTPHSQEFINFFGKEAAELKSKTIETVINVAIKYNCYILLKDTFFVFTTPKGLTYIIEKPMRILAQAGSGDILAGLIGGLTAQNYSIEDAVLEGIRVFYNIADYLSKKNSNAYIADEFIDNIELFNK